MPKYDAEVIVIGAGAAGLSAAAALDDEDYDVIVLEGRDRIGGRVWTERSWDGLALDMGATWIHGTRNNPVTALAHRFKAATAPTDYEELWLYDTDGREFEDREHEALEAQFDRYLEELESLRERYENEDRDDISLEAAFHTLLGKKTLSKRQRQSIDYLVNSTIEHEYAADIADLSFYYWDEGGEFGGGDQLFPGGYDQIFTGLAEELDVRLNHVVQRVEYDGAGVRVTTNQGVLQAEYAVVTLPLGVLKQQRVEFSPPLPKRKLGAIQRMGMGVLNKLYLRFPRTFWPKESELLGYIAEQKGEWSEFLNVHRVVDEPVLLGFNAGRYGRQIERLSDDQIAAQAMQVLRTMFGSRIPAPEAVLVSRWGADPFAGGSYSFLATGASDSDYDILAEPVQNRLFFAGEATSRQYAATVHGAVLSGRREARRIDEVA